MVLGLPPSHVPTRPSGWEGVGFPPRDLTASIWRWNRADDGIWSVRKVIEIPPEPADPGDPPPALKPFKAFPGLVGEIGLGVDDKFFYVSCWGTGECGQYYPRSPMSPRVTGSVRLASI